MGLGAKNATKGAVISILCIQRHLEDLGEDGDLEVRCHGTFRHFNLCNVSILTTNSHFRVLITY